MGKFFYLSELSYLIYKMEARTLQRVAVRIKRLTQSNHEFFFTNLSSVKQGYAFLLLGAVGKLLLCCQEWAPSLRM